MQDDFEDGGMGLPDDVSGGGELPDMEPGGEGDVELDIDSALEPGRPSGGARAVTRKSGGGGRKSAPSKPARKLPRNLPRRPPGKREASEESREKGREARKEGCETCEKSRNRQGRKRRPPARPRRRAGVVSRSALSLRCGR